jgi:hypothetical protein
MTKRKPDSISKIVASMTNPKIRYSRKFIEKLVSRIISLETQVEELHKTLLNMKGLRNE